MLYVRDVLETSNNMPCKMTLKDHLEHARSIFQNQVAYKNHVAWNRPKRLRGLWVGVVVEWDKVVCVKVLMS